MGKVIGEETGGWVVCYGDSVESKLPNSSLKLSVSSVKFVNTGANISDWNGVKPDKKIRSEKALEYVIKNIEKINTSLTYWVIFTLKMLLLP